MSSRAVFAAAATGGGHAGHRAVFRFYAELGDFLPPSRRQRPFAYTFHGHPSVKDAIEALGVPHPEVDLVLVNGVPVGFDHALGDGDRVSVYPVFEALDIAPVTRLRPQPLRVTRFVLDGHLGVLARRLRLLGFDTAYDRDAADPEIVARARDEGRIILTRDRELLKAGAVTHGYWVRATDPSRQLAEVVERFDLRRQVHRSVHPFTRCTVCNGELVRADDVEPDEVPPRVRREVEEFQRCTRCRKLYWRGSHAERLARLVDEVTRGEDLP